MKAFFQDDNHALSKFRCDVLSVYNCNYGYYSAYELLICVSSISNERSIINDYLTQKWKCFFSQMFSFHCSTLNTKTWDQQVKQDTPTIYSYYSEPPGPHWLLISWNFPFYLASNLNIFLSFDKTDSVTQKSVPRIFFLLYRKHPDSRDCYCFDYLCDWVELQSKQACFLFLQNLCSGLCVPGRWFLNAEREMVWLFPPYVLQFYFIFSKDQIHLGEAPWHCKVLPLLLYCFPVLTPQQQHKTRIPHEQLTK